MAQFCTTAQVKSAAGVTVATYDADISLIIDGVTAAMQRAMGDDIASTVYTAERHSLLSWVTRLVLNHRPIISVQAVRVDGVAISPSEYVVVPTEGILYNEGGWDVGAYLIQVDYTAGYATIPADLVSACIQQSRYQWSLHAQGGGRFGEAQKSDASGGSTAFIVDAWQPGVLEILKTYRRLI